MSTGRPQTYERGSLRVSYDPSVCTHAAACVRGLPAVFRPAERRWIQLEHAEADAIVAVVAQCPSGALRVEAAGAEPANATDAVPAPTHGTPATSDAGEVTITLAARGPLLVNGPVTIKTADGGTLSRQAKVALCRCGHTGNAPFCDGSHQRVGFSPTR